MNRLSRSTVVAICAIVLALAAAAYSVRSASFAESRLDALKSQNKEILTMGAEVAALRAKLGAFEKRRRLTRVRGMEQAADEVLGSLGLRDRLDSLKRLESSEEAERAELRLKEIDMNEMVNILYSLENAPMPLVIKKVEMKTAFDTPGKLKMAVTLALLKEDSG